MSVEVKIKMEPCWVPRRFGAAMGHTGQRTPFDNGHTGLRFGERSPPHGLALRDRPVRAAGSNSGADPALAAGVRER